jgi:hypothetical protein
MRLEEKSLRLRRLGQALQSLFGERVLKLSLGKKRVLLERRPAPFLRA